MPPSKVNTDMEFHRLWRVIVACKVHITTVTLTASLTALALTYALPSRYEASALVIVRPQEKMRLTPPEGQGKEVLDFPVSLTAPIDAPSRTYMEVLQSEAVAQRIVTALNLDAPNAISNNSTMERLRDEFRVWLRDTVRASRHLVRYGRVIPASPFELAVEDVRENLRLDAKKNTYAFSITYMSGSPVQAAAVANKAAEIFLAHNADAFRREAESSLKFIETRLFESEAKLVDAREALTRFKDKAGVFAINDEYREKIKVVSSLEVDVESAQARLDGLLQAYAPKNSKVTSAQAEVSRLRTALASHKADLVGLPARERTLGTLELAVSLAQENYEYIRRKYEESRIAEQTSFAEIRIASPATAPLYPTRPIKYYYAALGLLLALVSSIALVMFLENLNPRVRVADDVTTGAGPAAARRYSDRETRSRAAGLSVKPSGGIGSAMTMFTHRRTPGPRPQDDRVTTANQTDVPGNINYTKTQQRTLDPEVVARNLIVTGVGSDAVSSAYKMLRTHVLQRMNANGWNVLAITSPGPGEGKTLTALNLAITMAREVNHTVLLVELDLLQPTLHGLLGYEPGLGITDYLLRDTPLSEVMINPGIDRLVVIPAGQPAESSSELLSSPRMVDLVRELKERYPNRLVLFDVPPLLTSDDGLAFVPHVDAALLVVAEGQTSYEDVEVAKDMLASTHLLGAVMNRASSHIK